MFLPLPGAALMLWCAAVAPAAAQDHAGQYTQGDIDRGSRLYGANCAFCHGVNGDAISNVDLRGGKFRKATSDEELGRLIVAGIPGTAMPPHKFETAELTGIVAYVRAMRDINGARVALGDAARGKIIFEGKGACMGCHRVQGQGSRVAPDLSEIGAVRSPGALQKTLLDPTATMLPINRSVRAVTRDGRIINGRRLNEDTYSVQLINTEERLVSLAKADLKEYTVIKTSPMPSYKDKLSAQELGDVVSYLLTLKGAY
jgi:putative heme-binding domain-containing protein